MPALIRQLLFASHFPVGLLVGLWILLTWNPAQSQELTVSSDDWVYEEQAISIKIEASADLNSVSGRPHSLVIGVFQLNDPNTFSGLSVTREGAVQLLDNGLVDDSMVGFQQIIALPGETRTLQLARSRQAKYVGFIVGYFRLNPKLDIRIFPIPIAAVGNSNKAKPGKLLISIKLGSSNTLQISSLKHPQG